MEQEQMNAQAHMNTQYRRILDGLLTNAERDVRLARAEGDRGGQARAQARLDTLRAALEIYAASHLVAHGERPWPREVAR
ncbi:hypothetical protein QOL99_02210 [Deinococcus sp. MIMF12]|uniref:Uncharacterized protein n=1 Tax=Deinococcus rhizophilus TaxID=3049544 RepID=A0ABT7JD51_9DEIO|nr:hypothetical protein [Deinococcus rhizophilus]MDL2342957.1 hypothetical protein [Deinococcus rhizophilus]